jgi:hypothetical protein
MALSTRSSRPGADERLSEQEIGDAKPNAGPARRFFVSGRGRRLTDQKIGTAIQSFRSARQNFIQWNHREGWGRGNRLPEEPIGSQQPNVSSMERISVGRSGNRHTEQKICMAVPDPVQGIENRLDEGVERATEERIATRKRGSQLTDGISAQGSEIWWAFVRTCVSAPRD